MKNLKIYPNKNAFEMESYEIAKPFVVLDNQTKKVYYSETKEVGSFEYKVPSNVVYYTTIDGNPLYTTLDPHINDDDDNGEVEFWGLFQGSAGCENLTVDGHEYKNIGKITFSDDVSEMFSIGENMSESEFNTLKTYLEQNDIHDYDDFINAVTANYDFSHPVARDAQRLESLILPDGISEIENGFSSYANLKYIKLPQSLYYIGSNFFQNCTSLTSIAIPNSVEHIDSNVFDGCASLSSVKFDSNSIIESIENGAFNNCTSLTSIVIPDSVTYIGENAFYECSSLSNVVLSDSLTSINGGVFYLSGLTNITIPSSVGQIDVTAFSDNDGGSYRNLVIRFTSTIPPTLTGTNGSGLQANVIGGAAMIEVPKGYKQTYIDAWDSSGETIDESYIREY